MTLQSPTLAFSHKVFDQSAIKTLNAGNEIMYILQNDIHIT